MVILFTIGGVFTRVSWMSGAEGSSFKKASRLRTIGSDFPWASKLLFISSSTCFKDMSVGQSFTSIDSLSSAAVFCQADGLAFPAGCAPALQGVARLHSAVTNATPTTRPRLAVIPVLRGKVFGHASDKWPLIGIQQPH